MGRDNTNTVSQISLSLSPIATLPAWAGTTPGRLVNPLVSPIATLPARAWTTQTRLVHTLVSLP